MVCLIVYTPEDTLAAAWSLCSFFLTPHSHGATSGEGIALNLDGTKTLVDKYYNLGSHMQTVCNLSQSLTHSLLSRPDSTGNSIAMIKRLAHTTSITQQSILLNKQSSLDPNHTFLPLFLTTLPHVY